MTSEARTRRVMRRAALALALSPLCVMALSTSASAAAPQRVGWWTAASVTSPTEVVVPVGNDVPAGGMLVQSAADPTAPVAFGGATWELPEGTTVTKLVLKTVTNGQPSAGSLGLCALQRPDFTPAAGGAIAAAPAYDCSHQINATAAADGSFTFAAERFRTGPILAVAVVPTASLSRIVVAPLDARSLTTSSAAAPAVVVPPAAVPVEAPTAVAQVPVSTVPGLVSAPTAGVQAPLAVAPAPVTAGPVALAQQVTAAPRHVQGGFRHRGLLALLLATAFVGAWSTASASASRAPKAHIF